MLPTRIRTDRSKASESGIVRNGWIKLYRKLLSSDLWLGEKFTRGQAWVDLIGLARFRGGHVRLKGVRIDLALGELAFSEVSLAKRWKWSRGKVRRFLAELERDRQIVQRKTNVTSVITIVNYELYQSPDTADETPDDTASDTANGTADGTQNKKEKKEKNGKKRKTLECPAKLPAVLDNDQGRQAVTDWLEYKGGFTELGLKKLVTRMETRAHKFGLAAVAGAMDSAVANGNQGWDYDSHFGKTRRSDRREEEGVEHATGSLFTE